MNFALLRIATRSMAVSFADIVSANFAKFANYETNFATSSRTFMNFVVELHTRLPSSSLKDIISNKHTYWSVNISNNPLPIVTQILTVLRDNYVAAATVADALDAAGFGLISGEVKKMISGYVRPADPVLPAAVLSPAATMNSTDEVIRVVKKNPMPLYVIGAFVNGKMGLVPTAEDLQKKSDALEYLQATIEAPKYKSAMCGYYGQADKVLNKKSATAKLVEHAEEINSDEEEKPIQRKPTYRIKEDATRGSTKTKTEVFEVDGQEVKVTTGGSLPLFIFVFQDANGKRTCVNTPEPLVKYSDARKKAPVVQKMHPEQQLAIYILQNSNEPEVDDIEVEDNAVITVTRRK